MQVAHGLPEIFGGDLPLTVEEAYEAVRNTPFAEALRHAVPSQTRLDQPAVPDEQPLAAWRNVDLVFGQHQVLFDVSMEVRPQEWVALIGANGSGKTSLASLVVGFQAPTHGSVLVNDRPVRSGSISQQARTIAYLFQDADTMLFTATVERELQFGRAQQTRQRARCDLQR